MAGRKHAAIGDRRPTAARLAFRRPTAWSEAELTGAWPDPPEDWEFEHRVAELATGGIAREDWTRVVGPDLPTLQRNRPVPRRASHDFYLVGAEMDDRRDAGAVYGY